MLPPRNELQHRLAGDGAKSTGPVSYDKRAGTVEATVASATPVSRIYGKEVLRISPQAVDLSRLREGGIPLLDHHKQDGINSMLGKLVDAWIDRGVLVGRFKFNATPEGKKAEGMVSRGEVTGISAGYRVEDWEITDADGDVVEESAIRWDDDLTFTATRWQLFEASLVGVPADSVSAVRSIGGSDEVRDILGRMIARARIIKRGSPVGSVVSGVRARMRMRERAAGLRHE